LSCGGYRKEADVADNHLFIDTDCGIDDAVAILMALSHPAHEIVGISTLAGNVGRDYVTRNVCDLLSYVDPDVVPEAADIPVYVGASRPLVAEPVNASRIHGPTGLGTVELPASEKKAETLPAPSGLAAQVERNPGLTVVALGPLTNLALSINLYPEIVDRIEHLVVMGGALGAGNVTKFAEFNFFADPESVDVVFRSGIPLTIVPWDVCMNARMTPDQLSRAVGTQAKRGALVFELQEWIFNVMEQRFGSPFTALADPLAMACALEPDIIARRHDGLLRMELAHNALRGASVPWNGSGMQIIDDVDLDAFSALLTDVFTS
ncbi:MAG: nucleoside hydrolase, partial [bacterium]